MVVSFPTLSKSSPAPGDGQTEAYLSDRTHVAEAEPHEAKSSDSPTSEMQQEPQALQETPLTDIQNEASTTSSTTSAAPSTAKRSSVVSPGQSQFPPRLSREPRPHNSPYAHIDLPPFIAPATTRHSDENTSVKPQTAVLKQDSEPTVQADFVTLDMRPARPHVSSLWHRLRFNRFSPMANQRRSSWKPGKPRRGRPEGTKGAGSRSL